MSGRTIILVFLAVNLLLVQSKPAPIESSAIKVQQVDNLLNQLQQQETSSNVTKSQVQTSSSAGRQQITINGLLQNRNFMNQVAEFFQQLLHMYEYFIHGQSGSTYHDTQSSQTAESSEGHSASNNLVQATMRGLFSNPSFLNFLNGILPIIQGHTPFSHLSDYNVASQNSQNQGSESHVSNQQSAESTSDSTRGLFNNPAFLNFLTGFLQNNHASSFSHNQQNQEAQSHVSNSQFNQQSAASNHLESAGSNAASTNQHGFIGTTGPFKPLGVVSNAVVHNAASSNTITTSSNNAHQASSVVVGKPAFIVAPFQNANAITPSFDDVHQASGVVVDNAASTSQQDFVYNGHSGPAFTGPSDNDHQVPSVVVGKPVIVAIPEIVPSYNPVVIPDPSSQIDQASSLVVGDVATSSQVFNGQSGPVTAAVPEIVPFQNTATITASSNEVDQSSSSVAGDSSFNSQNENVINGHSRPVTAVEPEIMYSQNNNAKATNKPSDDYASSDNEQIQTEHTVNGASSQTSNVQQSLVSSTTESLDDQAVQSSEALLKQLLNEITSQPEQPIQSNGNIVDNTFNTAQSSGQQAIVTSQQNQASTSQNSASTSSEAILEQLRNEFSVPQVQVPSVFNNGASNAIQTNGQQQTVASQQQQSSHTSASSSSEALLEQLQNSNFNTASVGPYVPSEPTLPSQVNGINVPQVQFPLGSNVNAFNTFQTNGQHQVVTSQQNQASTSQNSASTSSEAIMEQLRNEFSVPQVQVPSVFNNGVSNAIQTNGQQQTVTSQQQQSSTSHTSASSSSEALLEQLQNSNFNTASVEPYVPSKPTLPSQVNGINVPQVQLPLGSNVNAFNTVQTNGQHQVVTSQQNQASTSQNSASTSSEAIMEQLRNEFSVPQVQVPSVFNNGASNAIQTNGQQQTVASQQQQSSTSHTSASSSSEALLEQLQNSNFNTASVEPYVPSKPTLPSQVNGINVPQVQFPLGSNVNAFNTVQTNGQHQVVTSQQNQASTSQNSASTSSEAIMEQLRNEFSVPQVQVPSVYNNGASNAIQTNGQQQTVASQQQQSSHTSASSSSEALFEELRNNQYNYKPVVPLGSSQSSSSHHTNTRSENEADFKRQAQNANYQFATQVDDNINGNFQQRAEIREGSSVHGKYSYDDGFVWRTVYYVADENGYRILKEEVSPSRMASNINGEADVQTFNAGNLVKYHITKQDIGSSKRTHQQQYGLEGQQRQYGVATSQQ